MGSTLVDAPANHLFVDPAKHVFIEPATVPLDEKQSTCIWHGLNPFMAQSPQHHSGEGSNGALRNTAFDKRGFAGRHVWLTL